MKENKRKLIPVVMIIVTILYAFVPMANAETAEEWNDKGILFIKEDEYDEAIKCFDKAIAINSSYTAAWHNKGSALSMRMRWGDKAKAIECFDKAITLNSNIAEIWHGNGSVLLSHGSYKEATECFDKAIALFSHYGLEEDAWHSWYGEGWALRRLDEHEKAIKCFNKAILLEPRMIDDVTLINKGIIFYEMGKYEESIKCFDKAISLSRNDGTKAMAWNNKGLAFYKMGEYGEAIKCFDKATLLAGAWNNKGNLLQGMGKNEEAIECYDRAISICPDCCSPLINKAVCCLRIGEIVKLKECMYNITLHCAYDPTRVYEDISWYLSTNATFFVTVEEMVSYYTFLIEAKEELLPVYGTGRSARVSSYKLEELKSIEPIPISPLGFEAIFAIAGLLAVAYLLRRRE